MRPVAAAGLLIRRSVAHRRAALPSTTPSALARRATHRRQQRGTGVVYAYSLKIALNGRQHFESCESVVNSFSDDEMEGKRVLITGATGGIGKRTAQALVELGATVLVTARSVAKAEECAAEIGGEAVPFDLDLGSQASIRSFLSDAVDGGAVGPLDVVIANAGIGMVPGRQKTVDGHDICWGTNHLGHFALVQGLLPLVRGAPEGEGRIVVVASETHREVPSGFDLPQLEARAVCQVSEATQLELEPLCDKRHMVVAYEYSKLCNLRWAGELQRRLRKQGIAVHACCPGFVQTGLRRSMAQSAEEEQLFEMLYNKETNPMLKDVSEGAATTVFLAAAPSRELGRELYWTNCHPLDPSDEAMDREQGKALWELSDSLITAYAKS